MCADFRVKCEVEVRGLTALFLYPHTEGTPYLRFLAGGICENFG
ncbi:unknown [Eggerthella sp. CAG:209]|nr:unknown [Eggerthella sp. CAG:209]